LKVQNWANEIGYKINLSSKLFIIRNNLIYLIFLEEVYDYEFLKKLLIDIRNLNSLIKCLGIYKTKNKKHWELN
jgi:hypothetical protein